jgi:hypothetical protein
MGLLTGQAVYRLTLIHQHVRTGGPSQGKDHLSTHILHLLHDRGVLVFLEIKSAKYKYNATQQKLLLWTYHFS